MTALNELLYTPIPSGTRGHAVADTPKHAVAGAPERTRSGMGVQAGANAANALEHAEPTHTSLHDAIKRYGVPLPLEAIYAANTISRADFDRLSGQEGAAKREPSIEAPAFIERLASTDVEELSDNCCEWARRASAIGASWVWMKCGTLERGMATALHMARASGLDGRVARLSQLASLCRRAPLYGADSKEAVIFEWADVPVLALAITHPDECDKNALEALSILVNHRHDEMLPTLIVSTSTGADLFSRSNKSDAEASLCTSIAETLRDGLTGFQGETGGKPNIIDLTTEGRK